MWRQNLLTHLLGPGGEHVDGVANEQNVGRVLQEGRQVQVHDVLGHVLRRDRDRCVYVYVDLVRGQILKTGPKKTNVTLDSPRTFM